VNTANRIASALSETWAPVPDDWPYQVSDAGRVWSEHGDGRILQPYTNETDTYHVVDLRNDGKRWQRYIHRLVLEAHRPRDGAEDLTVHHLDGDTTNNSLGNLEWTTKETHDEAHAVEEGGPLGPIEEDAPF